MKREVTYTMKEDTIEKIMANVESWTIGDIDELFGEDLMASSDECRAEGIKTLTGAIRYTLEQFDLDDLTEILLKTF